MQVTINISKPEWSENAYILCKFAGKTTAAVINKEDEVGAKKFIEDIGIPKKALADVLFCCGREKVEKLSAVFDEYFTCAVVNKKGNANPGQFVPYKDINGVSGVDSYWYDDKSITVMFKGGAVYKYFKSKVGPSNFENMCGWADIGHDLNGYIMRNPIVKYGGKKIQNA